MADLFNPRFVDLVRNYTTTTGTGDFTLGPAVNGFTGLAGALSPGDRFYYSCIGVDKPAEREVGRGTLTSTGKVVREPISGSKTSFSSGNKSIALVAAAEWHASLKPAIDAASTAVTTLQGQVDGLSSGLGGVSTQVAVLDSEMNAAMQDIASLDSQVSAVSAAATRSAATRAGLAGLDPQLNGLAVLREFGRVGTFVFDSANLSASVTLDSAQGIYVAPSWDTTGATGAWVRKYSGPANAKWFGVTGDGATDDSTALTAALAIVDHLLIPAGTYIASAISVPANKVIDTAGFDTIIKQKAGTAANTRLISVTGSNVRIGDISVEGQLNQAGDTTGEQNHGIFIALNAGSTASITNVSIGNVKGTNIRGDVVYIGSNPTAYAAGYRVTNVSVGKVSGSNVYRNICSVTGGSEISVECVTGSQVGYMHLDLEPDVGSGPVEGFTLDYLKGRNVSLVGPTTADYISGVVINHLDLDPAFAATCSPAYSVTTDYGLQIRNIKGVHIERARINGFNSAGVFNEYSGGELATQPISFGSLEITECSLTNATRYGYVTGASGVTRLKIDFLKADVTLNGTSPSRAAILTCDYLVVHHSEISTVATTQGYRSCLKARIDNLKHSGAGIPFMSTDNLVAVGGVVAATAATLSSYSNNITFIGYDATATTLFNTCTNTRLLASKINGTFYADYAPGVVTIGATGAAAFSGNVTSAGTGIGYATGAGGTVTQITSKATGVTLNKACGEITLNAAALAADTAVTFVFTNTAIAVGDRIVLNHKSGGTFGAYLLDARAAAGSATVMVRNVTAGSLTEAIVVGFAVVKAVTS